MFILVRIVFRLIVGAIMKGIVALFARKTIESRTDQYLADSTFEIESWEHFYLMARLSRAIYDYDNHELTRIFKFIGYEFVIKELDEVKYVMYTNNQSKQYGLIVRGTKNLRNLLTNLRYYKDKSERLGCKLHTGFHRAAEKVFEDFNAYCANPEYSVIATGHSLGGAIAAIVGLYCDYSKKKVDSVVTFGQPKFTDAYGTEILKDRIPYFRIVNETDIISFLPPLEPLYFTSRYTHFGTVVKLCNHEYYALLDYPASGDKTVNSFWLNFANDAFSFREMINDLKDHGKDKYVDNIRIKRLKSIKIDWKSSYKYHD